MHDERSEYNDLHSVAKTRLLEFIILLLKELL